MVRNALIESKRTELERLCRAHRVRRLDLFGSATREDFDPQRSDLDFVVEFDPPSTGNGFDQYFDFKFDLERLFARPVDLVELPAVTNPYVREQIERTRTRCYDV